MDADLPVIARVVEFELKDSAPSVFICVEEILQKIVSSGVLEKVVLMNGRFLKNSQSYKFGDRPFLSFSKGEVGSMFSDIVSSCVDKGHLSCLFVLNKTFEDSYSPFYKKNSLETDFFSDINGQSPLSGQQRKDFFECIKSLHKEGGKFFFCFSHDAEFIYFLDELQIKNTNKE